MIEIHGKQYITVAERLIAAKEDIKSVTTEVLQFSPTVVVKATVVTKKGTFTGISAANPTKAIEKSSPYEVAETSAVGRALGFAGYEITEGVATADEIKKAEASDTDPVDPDWISEDNKTLGEKAKTAECPVHHTPYTLGKYGYYCKNRVGDGWCKNKPYSQLASN